PPTASPRACAPHSARPMSDTPLVLAVDQGTSGTKALLVDDTGAVRNRCSVPVGQTHPQPGWAEQDADEIWESVRAAGDECLTGRDADHLVGSGLSPHRESTLLGDRRTGRPLGPVLGWQDGRGADICAALRRDGHAARVRAISGLPLDPMFSAAKATW